MALVNLSPIGPERSRRWKFADCEFVEISRELLVGGAAVKLESKPLDVLQHLLEHPNQVLSKDELIGAAWNTSTTDQSLATAISKLRRAFGGSRDAVILNVSGVGYRMAVPVACTIDFEPPPLPFELKAGDTIPGKEHWAAVRRLGISDRLSAWLCEHRKTREAHVFKFASDGIRLRSLQREVAISRLLQKTVKDVPGFVRVLEWDFERQPYFIESEYLGPNLFEFAETPGFIGMSLAERIAVAAQVAETVAAAHSVGILHNDLKPSNILIAQRSVSAGVSKGSPGPSAWEIKVVDFGVASLSDPQRLAEFDITHNGAFDASTQGDLKNSPFGTAMYRAPELLAGTLPTVRADVYALGVILYQLACGDFLESPSPGWEARIPDPLLRQDIAESANVDPDLRLSSADELVVRLRTLDDRRAEQEKHKEAAATALRQEHALAAARVRRPWVIAAALAMIVGLCVSLFFFGRAVRDRDVAYAQSQTLSAMNSFLTQDLLAQSDPYSVASAKGANPQETLIAAIDRVLPLIDQRFRNAPEAAGRLHAGVAAALANRTDYSGAQAQFKLAAQRFREAQGALSQDAIIAELRFENTLLNERTPQTIAKAESEFAEQQKLIARINNTSAELQAWQALTQAGLLAFGPHPENALPVLTAAVHRAEATPDFERALLVSLKLRFCAIYINLQQWNNLERVAREAIKYLSAMNGPESSALFQPQMFLEEALDNQGRYQDAIALGKSNYSRFSNLLGPLHLMTLGSLYVLAEAEGRSGDYDNAIKDAVSVYRAALNLPFGSSMAGQSLSDAASFECHAGRIREGLAYAHELIDANPADSSTANMAKFTNAECLLIQAETDVPTPNPASLAKVAELLGQVQLAPIAKDLYDNEYRGNVNLAKARLNLLTGDLEAARKAVADAAPDIALTSTDPYEQRIFKRVSKVLSSGANGP